MNLSKRSQLVVGVLLVLLMAMTRGNHFTGINMPSSSWAAFFLAGVLLRPRWVFGLLFLQALLMDLTAAGGGYGSHCMSPAYWMLVPAYGALWFGGRLYAGWHRDHLISVLLLAPILAVSALVAQTISSGGFYWLSGRHADQSISGMLERIIGYYPQSLSGLALYVGLAAVVYVTMQMLNEQRQIARDQQP